MPAMSRRQPLPVLCGAVLAIAAASSSAMGNDLTSGVAGMVVVSPSCPGPQRLGEDACTSPLADAKLSLKPLSHSAQESADLKSSTNSRGRFSIAAPPGRYLLRVEVEGLYPRCPPVKVKVRRSGLTHTEVRCDSGMR